MAYILLLIERGKLRGPQRSKGLRVRLKEFRYLRDLLQAAEEASENGAETLAFCKKDEILTALPKLKRMLASLT